MKNGRACWGATIGATLAYTLAAALPSLPGLYYFPRLARWGVAGIPDEPAIRWYGCLLYGVGGAVLGMFAGRLLPGRPSWKFACLLVLAALMGLWCAQAPWFLRQR